MRPIVRNLVVISVMGLLFWSSSVIHAQTRVTYVSTPNAPISQASPVRDTLTVTNDSAITNVRVMVNISHTHSGDLTLRLQHVTTGTTITLLQRLNTASSFGCSANILNVTFDDGAGTALDNFDCSADAQRPATGRYRPTNALSAFNGQSMAGQWTLEVIDNANGDDGTLHGWALVLNDFSSAAGGIDDGRVNNRLLDLAAPVAIYCESDGLVKVYDVVDSAGTLAFVAEVPDDDETPDVNTKLADGLGNELYRLTTGEFQVNAAGLPGEEHKQYIFIWKDCS